MPTKVRDKKATFGRAFARRFNVSLLREPHIALPIKDNELVPRQSEETGTRQQNCLFLPSIRKNRAEQTLLSEGDRDLETN